VAADGVAPVRIAAVGDDVAGLEGLAEPVQHCVDRRARRDVEQDSSRRPQLRVKLAEVPDFHEPCFQQVARRAAAAGADDPDALLERVVGEAATHFAETDDAKFLDHLCPRNVGPPR